MLITFAAPRLNDPAQPNKWGVNVGGGRNNSNHGGGVNVGGHNGGVNVGGGRNNGNSGWGFNFGSQGKSDIGKCILALIDNSNGISLSLCCCYLFLQTQSGNFCLNTMQTFSCSQNVVVSLCSFV